MLDASNADDHPLPQPTNTAVPVADAVGVGAIETVPGGRYRLP